MLNLALLSMIQNLNKGEIWLANLNPQKGTEPGELRPVLIFQDQALLDVHHPSTIIIPLTTKLIDGLCSLRIRIEKQGGLEKASDLLIDQIRAIDNKRLTHGPLTRLNNEQLELIYGAVARVIGRR